MIKTDVINGTPLISLAMIATYPEMSRILEEIVNEEGIKLYNEFASFDEAAVIAKKIEPMVDAILTRGGTGEYIRRAVKVPVISIPISPFDLTRSVYRLPPHVKEIAFFNFSRNIYGVRDIEQMFNIKIHEYTFIDKIDIEKGVTDAKNRGIKLLIGGAVTARLAQQLGMEGIEIISDKEAIHHAVYEAIHIVKVRREEQARAARLKIAFDSITEGIVVADESKTVSICNPAAENIFNLKNGIGIGKKVEMLLPCKKLNEVYDSGECERNYLQEVYGNVINMNHLPIYLDDKFLGVVSTFEDVTKIQNLENQIRKTLNAKGFLAKYTFDDIHTNSSQMASLKELSTLYASTGSAILIEGESGTGKELFAQSIHNASKFSSGPFVAVNCAAIPEQLLESELFGYDPGAFTGAKKEGKPGLFELAHNGTIFLDEVSDIPKSLQSRLLRVLQEKEIMRVGGGKIVPVNIRIISATNQNLRKKVEEGDFREDLFYRLNVFNIKLPPLKERKQDIELLYRFFLQKMNIEIDMENENLLHKLLPSLMHYDWPGNIRELYNFMERISLISKNPNSENLWKEILDEIKLETTHLDENNISLKINMKSSLKETIAQIEKDIINTMIEHCNNDQELALQKLGIARTTMWRKTKESE